MTAPIFPLLRRPRAVPSKAPFTPASISGLVAWYDASNAASITASSGAVSQINDLSGNGNHMTQATGTKQPTTGTRTQNGLNVLDFDGTNDNLDTASLGITQPFTIYAVLSFDAVGRWNGIVNGGGANRWFESTNTNVWQINYGASLNGPATAVASYVAKAVGNGASSSITINNGTPTSGAAGSNGITTLGVGRSDTADYMDGWIAEVVVVNASVSAGDDAAAWAYLNAKWAVY